MNFKRIIYFICILSFIYSCNGIDAPLSWSPQSITDTSDLVITCNAMKGNRALFDYKGKVYVYLGLITDMSGSLTNWQYNPFEWGVAYPQALAKTDDFNKWSYSIHNVRKFFGVPDDEKIIRIVLVFRSESCMDSCRVQKNADGSDMFIPVTDLHNP